MISQSYFLEFNNENNEDSCLDLTEAQFRLTEKDAKTIMKKVSGCDSTAEFEQLESKTRDAYISKLKQKGLSIRQITRLTGVSFAIVRKL